MFVFAHWINIIIRGVNTWVYRIKRYTTIQNIILSNFVLVISRKLKLSPEDELIDIKISYNKTYQ